MPRPKRFRHIQFNPSVTYYKPRGVPMRHLEEIELSHDELEAVRLADCEELNQTAAAEQMKISQSTFQRIITSAHEKIGKALTEGMAIKINIK
ncbi:DUF134 domain-containing protein [Patescibacteria group bacterium]|nr:DUF134 domain-containing protein [Patescibacteria group bacterium]